MQRESGAVYTDALLREASSLSVNSARPPAHPLASQRCPPSRRLVRAVILSLWPCECGTHAGSRRGSPHAHLESAGCSAKCITKDMTIPCRVHTGSSLCLQEFRVRKWPALLEVLALDRTRPERSAWHSSPPASDYNRADVHARSRADVASPGSRIDNQRGRVQLASMSSLRGDVIPRAMADSQSTPTRKGCERRALLYLDVPFPRQPRLADDGCGHASC
ncbi:hypothetical protein OH77DRAFT_876697 [Trametes cingulata]|nr:hypothetical protein OH77DRAFT_876697 [Trametes cingulata]